MPYKDPERKRRVDRERRSRGVRPALDEPGRFASWLTHTVTCYDVGNGRAWSTTLAAAMQQGSEYDSYLRRVASGKVTPRPETAWEIGEGLRSCGLRWASGAYALKHCSRFALCCVLDIAAVDEPTKSHLCLWAAYTDLLDGFDQGNNVFGLGESHWDASVQAIRSHVAVQTHILQDAVTQAWATFAKSGMRDAHGLLGIAAQVWQNPRSGPAARQAFEALYSEWRGDPKRLSPHFNLLPKPTEEVPLVNLQAET